MPWLTPDSLPTEGDICRPLFIPNDLRFLAAVSGALYDLTIAENWELFGAVTPAEAAARARAMLESYFTASCPSGGPGMPLGAIFPYLTSSPPSGAVACDGAVYADTDYPDFWAVIDPAWKTDATHWQAPDLRDRFPVGAGSSYDPGDTGGADSVGLDDVNMPGQSVVMNRPPVGGTASGKRYVDVLTGAVYINYLLTNYDTPHENRPPYLALPYALQVE